MKGLVLTLSIAALLVAASTGARAQRAVWTGSWAAAPVAAPPNAANPNPDGSTYRNIVHLSQGGRAIRVHLSNEFGAVPLTASSVHLAVSGGADALQPGTDRAVTFGGAASVTIPAGAEVVSDAIAMSVEPFADLAISFFIPQQTGIALTYHNVALSTNYVAHGDVASAATLTGAAKVTSWYLLKAVDIDAGPDAASIVVLGASQAEGFHSTPGKNARWSNVLATRLQAASATARVGVLNEGISGNRILHDGNGPSALARLDRDVLAQSGARFLIVSEGTNDIGHTFLAPKPNDVATTEQIEWGWQQIALRAHARGMKVYITTLLPFGGHAYFTPASEQMRQAVNAFLKTCPDFDGVLDFDKVVRDPAHPEAMLPAYDSGDHLHPNDAGYKALGEAIDLKLFIAK
jgi:lysophospholipase L1-like esterase